MTAALTPLQVGDVAPDFTLADQNGVQVTLSEVLASKAAFLVFYPASFSGICTGELGDVRDHLEAFESDSVQVFAISCDSMFSLRAWADQEGYFFPLLSDFWPHGAAASAYGVFREAGGVAVRGTFLVGRDGRIAWSLVNGPGEARDFEECRAAIAALT